MVYEYTKPRAPIAAHYSSPGPCYPLPVLTGQVNHDPRSVHVKKAAWPFGVKHGKFSEDCSPGPVHYPDMKTTRHGYDGTPHYSLYGKNTELSQFKVPGPGTYCPEKVGQSAHFRAPQFSFGSRTRLRKTDKIPAPNSVALPTCLGATVESGKIQAPSFSLPGRSKVGEFSEDLQKTPGPGTYKVTDPNIMQNKAPLYSMNGRNHMPSDTTTKPGPGAHSPEKVRINKKSAPQPSFGIRHSQYLTPLIVDVCD